MHSLRFSLVQLLLLPALVALLIVGYQALRPDDHFVATGRVQFSADSKSLLAYDATTGDIAVRDVSTLPSRAAAVVPLLKLIGPDALADDIERVRAIPGGKLFVERQLPGRTYEMLLIDWVHSRVISRSASPTSARCHSADGEYYARQGGSGTPLDPYVMEVVRMRDAAVVGQFSDAAEHSFTYSAAISSDGRTLVGVYRNGTVFQAVANDDEAETFSVTKLFQLSPPLDQNGMYAATGVNVTTGEVLFWDAARRELILYDQDGTESWSTPVPQTGLLDGAVDSPNRLEWLADGRHVFCEGFIFAMLLDVEGHRVEHELCPWMFTEPAIYSPDGRFLALASRREPHRFDLWDLQRGTRWRNYAFFGTALVLWAGLWGWDHQRRRPAAANYQEQSATDRGLRWALLGLAPTLIIVAGLTFAVAQSVLASQGPTLPLQFAMWWPVWLFAVAVVASYFLVETSVFWLNSHRGRAENPVAEPADSRRVAPLPAAPRWYYRRLILGGVFQLWLVLPLAAPVMPWSPLLAILARISEPASFNDPTTFIALVGLPSLLIGLLALRSIAAGMDQATAPELDMLRRHQRWSWVYGDLVNATLSLLESRLIKKRSLGPSS